MKKRTTINASKIIFVIVVLFLLGATIKTCYVALSHEVDGISLQSMSSSITTVSKTLYADRGSIYDINGDELASSVNSYTVIAYLSKSRTKDEAHPQHVVDINGTAKSLAPILNMSEERLVELMSKDAYQVELGPGGRGITETVKSSIEKLELPGISFISNSKKRYYSKATFASYIVGYAKENEDGEIEGELGIEGYYDDILSGTNGSTTYLKYTSSNYKIPNTPETTKEAVDGADIYLTIDSNIQLIAEKAVSRFEKELNTEWSIFAVMDANTGAIVASATSPNFDPNNTNTIKSYMNPLVSYQYEPGSVMKIFSFASAIEEGKYNGDETYKSGSIKVADATIRDANRDGWGTITFDTGFAYSSNVAATTLALRLGADTLSSYYRNLGFGSKTGIELSNEASGSINIRYQTELANASFGQGISVTPIQMLEALSSMTNDGVTIKPYIVDHIVDANGEVIFQGGRSEVSKVYSSSTVAKMHTLMHKVVYESLTKKWQASNVTLMGKTGTAQIASPKGGYLTGNTDYVRSFAGIFPEDNPKYIAYAVGKNVSIDSVLFSNIITTAVEEIASYAKITEKSEEIEYADLYKIENYISKEVSEVKSSLKDKNIELVIIGDGKYVTNQYPVKGTTLLAGGKLFILTNGSKVTTPDMTGWSLSEAKTWASLANIELEYSGYGYVKTQIASDKKLVIELGK